jgi:predicted O-methyltransferase YrrM
MNNIKSWKKFFSNISYKKDFSLVFYSFIRRRYFPIDDEFWFKINQIGGFLTRKEAGLLFWASCNCPVPGPVIELGSYQGRSTIVFAMAGRHVNAIDAWLEETIYDPGVNANDVYEIFQKNLRKLNLENWVTIHRGLTHRVGKFWDEKCAILFIDAGHKYKEVKRDISVWTPHVHKHGFLIMHDVLGDTYFDVTRAAGELLPEWKVIASSGSAVAFKRK